MEPTTNPTSSNAYRVEAAEKRQQSLALAAQANDLEAQANEIDGIVPEEVEDTPEEDTSSDSKKKFLGK